MATTEDAEEDVMVDRGLGSSAEIEDAAWFVLEPGLRGAPSPLDPSVITWTAASAEDLLERVGGGDETSKDSFLAKLERQLAGAPRAVILLAAELLYLQVLPLVNVLAATKRQRVETVLSWTDPAPGLPPEMIAGLEAKGVFHGGTGFNVQIWQQVLWLCRFVSHWCGLPPESRANALSDPWAFGRAVSSTPQDWPSIRQSLQYLAWPGWYESAVAASHRRQIRDAFAYRIGGATGNDDESINQDLRAIRSVVDAEASHRVDWYMSPYVEQWWKQTDAGQRAWLVRPRQGGAELVTRWKDEGFVSLVARHLGEVPSGADLAQVRAAVETGYQHQDYAQRLALAHEYHGFLSRMKSDDIVVTVADDRVHVGVVAGEPEYVADEETRLRRAVAWTARSLPTAELASPVPSLLDQQGTVVDLTAGLAVLATYLVGDDGDDMDHHETTPPLPTPPDVVPILPAITESLAASVHMTRAALQEFADLLQTRQQIVFFGPPGTGKTYLAKKLAGHFVGGDDPSRAQLVQFHPSYAYEDFFEGYRPDVTPSGQATFTLQPGPLRDLASEARKEENRAAPFVLIIDEMNRANLAKVFGELYFLLEYRNESIRLQYQRSEPFRLPRNLFIIGTMNTSDRSIALVDAAIRRRFAFVELHPDEDPVRGVLAGFLAANHRVGDERVALLTALNAAIEDQDRDLRIGPSYLMKPDAEAPGGLERVWKYDLLPLLEEHYYGRLTRAQVNERFGLAALRATLHSAPAATDVAESTHAEGDDGVGGA